MSPLALLLTGVLLRHTAGQICPTFPDSSELAWSGFPVASDGQLVLIHAVPFENVKVRTSWVSLQTSRCSVSGDGSNCAVEPPVDLTSFNCELVGVSGFCMLQQHGPTATILFPEAYVTSNLKLRVWDKTGQCGAIEISRDVYVYSKYVALAPLLIVLILTPLTRELYFSLGLGGLVGTWILKRDLWEAWLSFWHHRVQDQLTSFFALVLWTMFLMGGIGGLALRSGGVKGVGTATAKFIKDYFLGQAVVFLLGVGLFMGGNDSAIIVGLTLQPITETMRISREKLSFLVDCTAAPIAGLMPLSTWIAFELSQIQLGLDAMQNPPDEATFSLLLRSIPRRFYSFFMLFLVVATVLMGREWGFMYKAEMRARRGEGTVYQSSERVRAPSEAPPCFTMVATENFLVISAKPGVPPRWWNAALPFFSIIAIFLPLLFYNGATFGCPEQGWNASARDILSCADAFSTLHWTCGSVLCVQILMYACQYSSEWGGCLLWPRESIDAALNGSMLFMKALVCLLLAFTYARTVRDLLLDRLLVDALGDGVTPLELPAVIFLLCALFSLATGTSWGTMSVFMPIVLPLAEVVAMRNQGTALSDDLLVTTIAAVLGGAVWGDHCSPVSDTTILSAAACQCPLMDHTKTQMPYAAFAGLMSILFGFMPAGSGLPPGVCLLLGLVLIPTFHYCISLLGLAIPGFGGSVPVFVPSGRGDGQGFVIGQGFFGTCAALKNMLGWEVDKVEASNRLASWASLEDEGKGVWSPSRELPSSTSRVMTSSDSAKSTGAREPSTEVQRSARVSAV